MKKALRVKKMNLIKMNLEVEGLKLLEELQKYYSNDLQALFECEEGTKALQDLLANINKQDIFVLLNIQRVKQEFTNNTFYEEHKEAVKTNLEHNLSFGNLELEYKIFIEKYNALGNENASYNEVMAYEYDKDKELFDKDVNVIKRVLKVNKNMYLWGNRGNGKTTLAKNIASELGLKCYDINSIKEEYDLKGFKDFNTNEYIYSNLENWYINGGVLLLDEVDTYDSNAMLYLNMVIEVNNKKAMFGDGVEYSKHKDCYVIGCANTNGEGKNSTHVGRNVIDKAFMDRFIIKEYKEYAFIHKCILGKNYKYALKVCKVADLDLTCRTSIKIKQLLEEFTKEEITDMIKNKEIELQ